MRNRKGRECIDRRPNLKDLGCGWPDLAEEDWEQKHKEEIEPGEVGQNHALPTRGVL